MKRRLYRPPFYRTKRPDWLRMWSIAPARLPPLALRASQRFAWALRAAVLHAALHMRRFALDMHQAHLFAPDMRPKPEEQLLGFARQLLRFAP